MYGILTSEPIGPLLLAGVIPGLLTALAFVAYVVFVCWRRGIGASDAALAAASTVSVRRGGFVRRAMTGPYVGMAYAAILILVIIGGIYTGVFTSTEAAAVGAFAALALGIPVTIAEGNDWRSMLGGALAEAGELTSMVFVLLIGSAVFSYFLTLSGVAANLAGWVATLNLSPNQVVAICLLVLVPLGMFLDGMSMLLIVVPLVYPLLKQLGVDGIWFGVLTVMLIEIGLLTPPFGINVFVIAGIADDLPLEQAFAGVMPFIAIQFLMVGLIFFFPELVLFLPSLAAQ
jgi:tripartite ATP-independent transporter DctM subunit